MRCPDSVRYVLSRQSRERPGEAARHVYRRYHSSIKSTLIPPAACVLYTLGSLLRARLRLRSACGVPVRRVLPCSPTPSRSLNTHALVQCVLLVPAPSDRHRHRHRHWHRHWHRHRGAPLVNESNLLERKSDAVSPSACPWRRSVPRWSEFVRRACASAARRVYAWLLCAHG